MRSLARYFPLALAGMAALALACGGDSGGPAANNGSITGVAGDSQSAPPGATLPIPLSFVVLNAMGQPQSGTMVGWTVVSGSASASPPSSTTDGTGTASTTVTLGGSVGPVTIRGAVSGITPVDFHLSAVDPCFYDNPYTLGSTVNGALSSTDCRVGPGYYYDFYGFTAGVQQGFTATMTASFDTYLEVYRFPRTFVGFNDDLSSTSANSLVQAIVAPGTYVLAPNSYAPNMLGSYTLTSATRAQTLAGCEIVWATRGVAFSETIATTDCSDSIGGGLGYGDAIALFAASGSVLKIAERSTAVNAMLSLYRVDSLVTLVASNDDSSGTTTNAFLSYSVPQSATYFLFIGTAAPSQTGAYTLDISASTTLSGAPAKSEAAEQLQFTPLRLPRKWLPLAQRLRSQ